MGIVHLILGKANPEKMNGVNKVVYNIATKQAENKGNVEVWGVSENTEINYPERTFITKIFKKKRNPFSIPEDLKKEILAADQATVFHFHGGWIPIFASLSKFLKKNNYRYVITPHGAYNSIAMKKSKYIKKIYFKIFEKKVIENASKIHCIGESEIEGLNSVFPTSKGVLITYGYDRINTSNYCSNLKEPIIFGFVGRLDIHTKGLDILIESFAAFSRKKPNSKLWIVGDGAEKNDLIHTIKSYNISDKVELLGSKFGEEKNNLIKRMHIFVHPSRNEGLPVSVIEAADFGKPCIVTRNTNIGHLVEKYDAGICIPTPDPTLLTHSFITISEVWEHQKKYIAMSENAIQMVEEAFDWKKILDDMNTQLYNI